ncbi:hypothetical protein M3730_004415 [Salmonella enterica]|nr:hypothetical protein [Salmonella enterica]
MLKDSFNHMRKQGSKTEMITQSPDIFLCFNPSPAFQEWIELLKEGERLPRGRYFAGKKPGVRLL